MCSVTEPLFMCPSWISSDNTPLEYWSATPRIALPGGVHKELTHVQCPVHTKCVGVILPKVLWLVLCSYTRGEIPYGDLILQEDGANHMLFQEDRVLPYFHTAVRNFIRWIKSAHGNGLAGVAPVTWSARSSHLTAPWWLTRRHVGHAVRFQHCTLLWPNLMGG
jgi:hypothetical protein